MFFSKYLNFRNLYLMVHQRQVYKNNLIEKNIYNHVLIQQEIASLNKIELERFVFILHVHSIWNILVEAPGIECT